jgi:adenylate kinase
VLLGPPGAGKGTQAHRLADRYQLTLIATGDIFRSHVAHNTELGQEARQYMDAGELVPDDVVVRMVTGALAEAGRGFILDGFPRTRPQAEALDKALAGASAALDAVVLIEVPDQLLEERAVGRRSDPETGTIYHLKYNPPPAAIASRLVHRKDDTSEAVKTRIAKYHSETAPIIPFYLDQGILKRVDGVGDPDAITQRITAVLSS